MEKVNIGEFLRNARLKNNISRERLAEITKRLSARGIENVEKRGNPNWETLLVICSALGLTIEIKDTDFGIKRNSNISLSTYSGDSSKSAIMESSDKIPENSEEGVNSMNTTIEKVAAPGNTPAEFDKTVILEAINRQTESMNRQTAILEQLLNSNEEIKKNIRDTAILSIANAELAKENADRTETLERHAVGEITNEELQRNILKLKKI